MTSLYILRLLNKRQVFDVDDADRSSFLMLIEPPPQKKQKPASGGHWKVNNWKVLQSLKLDKNQVLVFDGPDPQRDPREPSDEQRIALITRLATASRSAGFDADKQFTQEDLRRMEKFRRMTQSRRQRPRTKKWMKLSNGLLRTSPMAISRGMHGNYS